MVYTSQILKHHSKSLWNASCPINRIPSDLLIEILQLLHAASRLDRRLGGDGEWLRLTHVCRYWRVVALSTPILWADIDLSESPHIVQHLLHYSRDALLDVRYPPGTRTRKHISSVLGLISPQMHRIRRLRCIGHSDIDMEKILTILSSDAPSLEVLDLRCYSIVDKGKLRLIPRHDQFPRLRSISLESVFVPWQSPVFRGLVALKLGILSIELPSIDVLLDIFQSCPDLEVFRMDEPPQQPAFHHWDSNRVVALPRLLHLSLNVTPDIPWLLDHLSIPHQAYVKIYGRSDVAMSEDDAARPFVLPFKTPLPNLTDVTELLISLSTLIGLELELRAKAGETTRFQAKVEYPRSSSTSEAKYAPTLYCAFAHHFASSPLTALSTSGMGGTENMWRDMLRQWPLLQQLHVQFILIDEAVAILRSLSAEGSGPGLLCPNLVHLSIPNQLDPQLLASVVALLDGRAARGRRLQSFAWRLYKAPAKSRFGLTERTMRMLASKVDRFECSPPAVRMDPSSHTML